MGLLKEKWPLWGAASSKKEGIGVKVNSRPKPKAHTLGGSIGSSLNLVDSEQQAFTNRSKGVKQKGASSYSAGSTRDPLVDSSVNHAWPSQGRPLGLHAWRETKVFKPVSKENEFICWTHLSLFALEHQTLYKSRPPLRSTPIREDSGCRSQAETPPSSPAYHHLKTQKSKHKPLLF